MSLECAECSRLMGPSEPPGSDGTLVYPVLPSIVWSVEDDQLHFHLKHALAQKNRSLCFRCIEDACQETPNQTLQQIYLTYLAEIKYRKLEDFFQGRWVFGNEDSEKIEAGRKFFAQYHSLPRFCLYCNDTLQTPDTPYFHAKTFDPVACKDHLGGFLGERNYQSSYLREGLTFITFCFKCFQKYFPRTFKLIGYDLSDLPKDQPDEEGQVPNFTIIVSPEVYQDLVNERGQEEADRWIQQIGASVHPMKK